MKKLIYREPQPITREEVQSALDSGSPEEMASALVSVAFHDSDWRWVQDKCLGFARNDIASVRQIAVTCLGHVARIHQKLDLEKVLPVLDKLSRDPEVNVEDTLDDIQMFMKIELGRK